MQQAKQIAIQLGTYDGITFTPTAEYATPKLYDVWNMTSDWNVEWLKASARQRALEGRDRAGVGGFRYEARVTFRTMLPAQAKAIRDLLNDIFEDPMFPRVVKISEDEDISNGEICNFRGGAYGIRRELTIGRQAVNMEFANLFRLNRVTDAELSNGNFVITSDTRDPNTSTAKFEYRDVNNGLLTSLSGVATAFVDLHWVGENKFVCGDGDGKLFVIEGVGSGATLTQLSNYGGAVRGVDIDEEGNIYSTHASGSNSVRKTDIEGTSIAADGNGRALLLVDGSHVYSTIQSSNGFIEKRSRISLDVLDQTPLFLTGAGDCMLIYPEHIYYLRNTTKGSNNIIRKISKSDMSIVSQINSSEAVGAFTRMEYDENGIIYVLTGQYILKYNEDLELISQHDLGFSGGRELAISTPPVNAVHVRYFDTGDVSKSIVRVYNRDTLALEDTHSITSGRFTNQIKSMNAHPGRADIKFKVLGLTKQF